MPDRTKNLDLKRRSTLARVHRFRARKRTEREQTEKARKIARRAELDAVRVARGLPPARTPSQRVADSRARRAAAKEAIRTESWFSSEFTDRQEAFRYLASLNPTETALRIEQALTVLEEQCRRLQLNLNRYVLTYGAEAARTARAVLWQAWHRLDSEHDLAKLEQAVQDAARQEHIQVDRDAHLTVQRQELQTALDFSQTLLENGGAMRRLVRR